MNVSSRTVVLINVFAAV
ncbi:stress response membrane protein YncL, partial [Shigella sonnei]|nr:stress response membrane protein YncL [Shigella sonnei]EGA1728380.1 stress response membrane protein YncL [Shigella sonnei]EIX7597316.1 stress response membrane protein YncL [Shigella sonnei]